MPLKTEMKQVFGLSEEVLTECLSEVQMCTAETLDDKILLLFMMAAVR